MFKGTFEDWKKKLKTELLVAKTPRRKPKKQKTIKREPFIWRVTSIVNSRVSHARAIKLAKAGEHVSPNPFCNFKKHGMNNPLEN